MASCISDTTNAALLKVWSNLCISIIRERVRNAESHITTRTYWTKNSRSGARSLCFNKPSRWVWCTQKIDNHWIGDCLTKIFIFSHFSLKIIRYFLWTLIHTIERTLFNTLCKEDGWRQRSYMMCLFCPNPHPSLVTAQSSNSLAHSLEPLPINTQLNSSTLRASVIYTVTPGQPHGQELLSFTLPLNRPRPPCSPSSQIPLKFLSSTVRSPRHCCLHKSKCKYL